MNQFAGGPLRPGTRFVPSCTEALMRLEKALGWPSELQGRYAMPVSEYNERVQRARAASTARISSAERRLRALWRALHFLDEAEIRADLHSSRRTKR